MIKKLLLTSTIILISFHSLAQEKNEFRLYYGISDSELLRNDLQVGSGSIDTNKFSEFGVRYLRKITDDLAFETGINYARVDLEITPPFMGETEPLQSRGEELEFLSMPLYANITLWNYLFLHGGPLIDFQLSENTTDSQSGIGYGLGFGGKFDFREFSIYLNPNFKRHAVLPFEKENNHQKLTEFGIQLGLGYKF